MKKIIFIIVVFSNFWPAFSYNKDTTYWSPEFSMAFELPGQTVISHNGKYIAYVVREALTEGEKSEYLNHIWLAATDGSFNYQYTQGDKSCSSPQFSPDGEFLSFTSSRDDTSQIYIMRILGGEAEKISDAENGVESYKWSADSKKIAFTMTDPETEKEKTEKEEKRDIIFTDKNFKNNHIYTLDLEKSECGKRNTIQITSGEFSVNGFDWSPDGASIVFSHQPEPTINSGFIESDISIVASDSGAIVSLIKRPGVDSNPKFSPNGKVIAYESNGGKPEAVGLTDIWTVSANGGKTLSLQETPNRDANLIGWSPDAKSIYVSEAIGTSSHLLSLEVKGESISIVSLGNIVYSERSTKTLSNSLGTRSRFSISSKVDAAAFIYEDTETLPQVFYSNTFPFNQKQISQLNENVELPDMAKTELISWKSSDGLEIEGLLTYPMNYKEGEKYPVILNVDGGPGGVYQQSFTGKPSIYLLQYFAENGYAIIRPNPRGSTGYGKEFRYANVRDWGYGDYEDLLSGVNAVIEMGIADEDQQYLMGWSYGGYMTGFMVTKTDRFNAASMGAGLPNLVSMTTTTDIPEYLVAHMGGKEFWEDYEAYEKHSAIYRIKNVKTPTQVIHGQNDFRIPFTQGQEFYVALKRLGVPTEMIVLPRTPHGPREPKLQMAVSPLILDWFRRYGEIQP
ncbi:MAG: S9 family peptidase [Bacteroidales bacterium]|nr:S9 family peptidase [Bacteroidales bacterium]